MKIKTTLLIAQISKNKHVLDDEYFKIYLLNKSFPSRFITTKNETETLKELYEPCLNIDFAWLKMDIGDFRICTNNNNERIGEVVYITYIPEILGCIKTGGFFSEKQIKEENIQIEDFYERIFARKGKFII